MTTAVQSPWFHRPRPSVSPRIRLFCFPYAGGAASAFHTWPSGLSADTEVIALAFPGRAFRLREAGFVRMAPLLDELERQIQPFLELPYAFFGHSMGAVIAYELTQRLRANGKQLPTRLLVSGRRAPHLPPSRRMPSYKLQGREFLAALVDYYDTPGEILHNSDLQELVVPALRADLELLETHKSAAYEPLPLPISAYSGDADPGVPVEYVNAWQQYTTERFELNVLPGKHMFLHSAQAQLLTLIAKSLQT